MAAGARCAPRRQSPGAGRRGGRTGGAAPAGRRRGLGRTGSAARRPGRRLPRTDPRRKQGGRVMNATAINPATPRSPLRSYWLEAKYEFLRLLRTPMFSIPTLLFPTLFYVLFGVLMAGGRKGGVGAAEYLLATYGVFGVMGAAMFGFGVS